ncbi:hypothetical protein GCM10022384_07410 [Streptomyces marokkonensis]|uniref:DUF732 domain-containing protein n=1 Tax=Streptomyces marokkonensis TaxID=324855 RepID=A0ABP7NYX3_9ACTN
MNTRTAAAALAAGALLALTACSSSDDEADTKPKAPATEQEPTQAETADAAKGTGLPPRPTGEKRQQLLDALAKAAPDVVRYEDKAVDAARNQCSAFGEGVKRPDWLASQRFTYKDVTTTEAQGKQINQALKSIGFCNV